MIIFNMAPTGKPELNAPKKGRTMWPWDLPSLPASLVVSGSRDKLCLSTVSDRHSLDSRGMQVRASKAFRKLWLLLAIMILTGLFFKSAR